MIFHAETHFLLHNQRIALATATHAHRPARLVPEARRNRRPRLARARHEPRRRGRLGSTLGI